MFIETLHEIPKSDTQELSNFVFLNLDSPTPSSLPALEIRDQYFSSLQLEKLIVDMDELDKDILYWRLHHDSMDENKKNYPHFSKKIWQNLRAKHGP